MKPLDRLSEYLGAIEKRLRLLALTRGIAVTAGLALALTVLAVLVINQFSFSNGSVISARVFLFLGLAAAIGAALVIPVIRLNRRSAARKAEAAHPQFEERLLTFTERLEQTPEDPFLELLALDTLDVSQKAEPRSVAKDSMIFGFSGVAVFSVAVLIWLGTTSGFMGYGTSLLWAGLPKGASAKPYYSIQVSPGNRTVRKRSDVTINAHLMGFSAPKVRFFAKYASASQWEQAEMVTEPGGAAYQFLIAGVPETLEYYVEAGGVKSDQFKLNVIDLPGVKKIRVTYHFPPWLGLKDAVEDPGGDLRAVEGTKAEVAVQTDRPLATGVLILDDGSKINLTAGAGGLLLATVPILKDGVYHVAAMEGAEDVRLSEDYFIEAQRDKPPEIKITRPGRDYKASPIEEVSIQVEAKDDFGLKAVDLHYSVNGGPEKTVSMLQAPNSKTASGSTLISLEDFKVEPGDVVALYATAKDAKVTTNTDIYFIEAQPFERNYTQSQQAGGGGGDGGDDEANQQNQISQRQKEIIAATWNQVKGGGAKGSDSENAAFLSNVQSKLRDQAKSLAERMKARQLTDAGDSFKSFVKDMETAVDAMGPAADKLKGAKWQDALAPEQKALQYLMRAEATFRDIQVAFGNQRQGGGGGGGGAGGARDLEGLFDLELDTEKNQYESNRSQQSSGGNARQQAIDDAMKKLEDLARRQQELADQARKNQQTSQQRWQQEQLRREAEQLQRQLEQLTRGDQNQLSRNGQQGQQSQQGQSGQQISGQQGPSGQQSGKQGQSSQSGQQGQTGQQQGQPGQQQQGQQQQGQQQSAQQRAMQQQMNQNAGVRGASPEQLRQMLDRLNQAMDEMRGAASSQQAGTPEGQAQARRAADHLKEIQQMAQGMRDKESNNQVESLVRQAEDLAHRQQAFEGEMRKAFGPQSEGITRDRANQLATEKEGEIQDLKRIEQGMQAASRDLQNSQRKAATKMRETLGEMQQAELPRDMQRNADWIRRGMGQYGVMSEATVTQGLNELRDQLKQVQGMLGSGKDGKDAQTDKLAEQTLGQVERLRQQLEQMSAQRGGQQQGQNGQRGGQQQGKQGGQQQGGQQQGGQQQGGQQAGGQQQGGQQQGGQQQGGQQAGGQQGGGQQAGGNQSGGNQQGYNQQGGQVGAQPGGGGPTYGLGGPRNGGYNNPNPIFGPYGGTWDTRDPRTSPVRPEDFTNTYNQTLQALRQLEQAGQGDPNMVRDLQNLIRDMQRLNPNTYANDPLLAERIQATLMGGVQQVEMELRRKVEESNGGSVRSPGGDKVPQGWEGSVAEYFRKLSKSKQ